jgi:hypothetical protein
MAFPVASLMTEREMVPIVGSLLAWVAWILL